MHLKHHSILGLSPCLLLASVCPLLMNLSANPRPCDGKVKPHRRSQHYRNFSLSQCLDAPAAATHPERCVIPTDRSLKNHSCRQEVGTLLFWPLPTILVHDPCPHAAPRDSCTLVYRQVILSRFNPRGSIQGPRRAYWSDAPGCTTRALLRPALHAGTGAFCEIWRSAKLVAG